MRHEKADSLTHTPARALLGRPLAFAVLLLGIPAATVLTASVLPALAQRPSSS
jgi:hypothetical protein